MNRSLLPWEIERAFLPERLQAIALLRVAAGQTPVSASTALRTARLLDSSIDDLLAGRFQPGVCPKCGHRPGYLPAFVSDFVDESTVVEVEPSATAGLKLVP